MYITKMCTKQKLYFSFVTSNFLPVLLIHRYFFYPYPSPPPPPRINIVFSLFLPHMPSLYFRKKPAFRHAKLGKMNWGVLTSEILILVPAQPHLTWRRMKKLRSESVRTETKHEASHTPVSHAMATNYNQRDTHVHASPQCKYIFTKSSSKQHEKCEASFCSSKTLSQMTKVPKGC